MINKHINDISEDDLNALIENTVLENKTIEYKKELPLDSDRSKKEFLADVTAFANAEGGDLIIGIDVDSESGMPISLEGLTGSSDDLINKIESLLRDSIEPRLIGNTIKPVTLSEDKYAAIIRINKSWHGPHRVKFRGHNKFYIRNSAGKHEMDIDELRFAFNISETYIEKVYRFRDERLKNIQAGNIPYKLYNKPKTVLHLIPIYSFKPGQGFDVGLIYERYFDALPLIYKTAEGCRYNSDGIISYSNFVQGAYSGYTQLFRNGIYECVDSTMAQPQTFGDEVVRIVPKFIDSKLIKCTSKCLLALQSLEVPFPIVIMVSLLGIKTYTILLSTDRAPGDIDKDDLILNERIFMNYDEAPEIILKPILDQLWNACGYPRSMNYDEAGNWSPISE